MNRIYTLQTLLLILLLAAAAALSWQAVFPHPIYIGGLVIDRLSTLLALLVSFVGTITYRFSIRYLNGEPRQMRFLTLICLTVCAAYLLMLSSNLLLLFAAWTISSFALHQLLTFYPNQPEAIPPARKKFLISRLGDAALIAAIILMWRHNNSQVIAVLITLAALTKSAQFPFHSWLPETMESPTPVSALMHAGIINSGGALLLRFAPLIAHSPWALSLLVVTGTLTSTLGLLSMWAQTKVKRTLAWSTVSQMGYMMVQIGLTAFPAAALHIVGHGLYKAWSFLNTGTLPKPTAPKPPLRSLALVTLGTIAACPCLYFAAQITGYQLLTSPSQFALAAIAALSIGQLWVSFSDKLDYAAILTPLASLLACAIYRASELFLSPVLGILPSDTSTFTWILAALPVAVFLLLTIVHALLPVLSRNEWGFSLQVHALHGFYFGTYADRFIANLWRKSNAASD